MGNEPDVIQFQSNPVEAVARVKQLLNEIRRFDFGWSPLDDTDGTYDGTTVQAVKNFQGDAGLTKDGKVGPLTWPELFAWAAADDVLRVALSFKPDPVTGLPLSVSSVSKTRMVAPPSAPLETGPATGFWFELRDDGDAAVYAQMLDESFGLRPEVPGNGRGYVRAVQPAPVGFLDLLVPLLEEAIDLVVFRSPQLNTAAQEFVRVSIDALEALV